ncbi:uncharacterized SAM-binding protein YcdF (DUF218 family) [Agrobacterium vitis]|nr:uncharacterized SAM-binding protein YcdF (DUF218 family) [Agrobacterium vitis]MBE1439346.1 uncharacterized SAM-binding protein YcdF (DUF218 family) [Agrobacterium vitis]
MFILSKLFWLVAQPLSLAFLFGLIGLAGAVLGLRRTATLTAGLGLLILFVTLYTSAGTVALQALEARFPRAAKEPEVVSCTIVLGGAFSNPVNTARGGFEMGEAGDRFVEALRLARNHPEAKILVSGGDGSLSGTYEGDAVTAERFFAAFGIGAERLIRDTSSRNTAENVINTESLLAQANLNDCLLITSAFHMPRAIGLMRKAGIVVTPWPTDYRTNGLTTLAFDFTQPTLNAQKTATALREWIGLTVYFLDHRTEKWPRFSEKSVPTFRSDAVSVIS